ncbi:TonB-dependent receptor [Flavicella sediminum]|uniref:TonB-dependent receptor n=1 Tax=Flavicella sediminum TaxID=2585141 RepID=UPI001123B28F|nr:TonB-dependent receptor [Flavicella sediminum]
MKALISKNNMILKKQILLVFLLCLTATTFAQQEKDTIATEVINVVTSYTPTISDAFKSKDNPTIDTKDTQKKAQTYSINETQVPSIFTPNVGSYKTAIQPKKKINYLNFVRIGYGNYGTPLVEAFLTKKNRVHEFDFLLYNKASNGGIKNVALNDKYLNTNIALDYKNKQRHHTWKGSVNYSRNVYNWYGLPMATDFSSVIDAIEEQQVYNDLSLAAELAFKKGKLKNIQAEVHTFSDKFDSDEMQLILKPQFEFPLKKNKILADVSVEILNGEFKQNYEATENINYGLLSLKSGAYYPIQKENLFFSIGAKINYTSDLENKTSLFKVYPDLKVDYVVVDELFNVYAGINGGLQQNTYRNLSTLNPYVSPSLDLKPTDNTYTVYTGLKGKLSSRINYNVKATYSNEDNKTLFRLNQNLSDGTDVQDQGYNYGNSFDVVYDNIKTLDFFGEISTELFDNLTIGANAHIKSYDTELEQEAWNLAKFNTTIFGDFSFQKWRFGSELYIVGKRKDVLMNSDGSSIPQFLKAYADLNINAHYQFSSKWSAFMEVSNLFNQNYQRFSNFEVQGFQIMAGLKYQFHLK